jgi:branched-chain amino acid transport system permease protein
VQKYENTEPVLNAQEKGKAVSINSWMFLEFSAVYILLTWAFYLPVKGGQISNSPVYILAITSYFSAFAMRELGWAYGPTLLVSVCIGALSGFITAIAFSKTRGFTLGIATIAVIFIVQCVIRNIPVLGGTSGFMHIPEIGNLLPITWTIVLIVGVIIYRIDHSRLGRAMEVMREHLDMAGAIGGVYPLRLGVLLQMGAGVITGAAGAIYPFIMGGIYPASFGFSVLLYIWTILFTGGSYTMWGTLVFAPFLWGLNQIIPEKLVDYVAFMFGSLLIGILVLRPEGAIDRRLIRKIRELFRRRSERKELPTGSAMGN